jgi:2-methylcitrate dehydratase PrpD
MILQRNHLQQKPAEITTHEVVDALCALRRRRIPGGEPVSRVRVHVDWIQCRQNFRERAMAVASDTVRREHPRPGTAH